MPTRPILAQQRDTGGKVKELFELPKGKRVKLQRQNIGMESPSKPAIIQESMEDRIRPFSMPESGLIDKSACAT
jgi:hypothetical protein